MYNSKTINTATPDCHPKRKHHAFGLCKRCYYQRRWTKIKGPVITQKRVVTSTERSKRLRAIRWPIKERHCQLCGMDFNPAQKKDQTHPDICSWCEKDAERSAFKFVDLTQEEVIHDER